MINGLIEGHRKRNKAKQIWAYKQSFANIHNSDCFELELSWTEREEQKTKMNPTNWTNFLWTKKNRSVSESIWNTRYQRKKSSENELRERKTKKASVAVHSHLYIVESIFIPVLHSWMLHTVFSRCWCLFQRALL